MRRAIAAAILVAFSAGFLVRPVLSQSDAFDGVFVVGEDGSTWVITGAQRHPLGFSPILQDTLNGYIQADQVSTYWQLDRIMRIASPAFQAPPPTPVPTAKPAPAAPVHPSATRNGVTVTILAVERPWGMTKTPNMDQTAVQIRIDNHSGSSYSYNSLSYKAVGSDGTRWDSKTRRDPALYYGDVGNNDFVVGWIIYEMPIGLPLVAIVWAPGEGPSIRIDL